MSNYHANITILSRHETLGRASLACAALMALAVVLASPVSAKAQGAACPKLAPVYSEIDATGRTLDPFELGSAIATTLSADQGLSDIVADLRNRFPQASDPELANVLMATYCLHLEGQNITGEELDKKLTGFEDAAYSAVYPNVPAEPKKEGWLYSE